ncbi:HAD family hydrolase [Leptospira sp. 96542]|nr:HAD family hydrolase [Leptospira sp. 96542]
MALFLDLDNTLLPSLAAYDYAIKNCARVWTKKELGGDFDSLYAVARKDVKNRLVSHTSNRNRLLCFKHMLDSVRSGGLGANDFETLLWLDGEYFKFFTEFLTKEKEAATYSNLLFPKLREIQKQHTLYLLTNETLRTQAFKLKSFFPNDIRFVLTSSEEVGFEKPSTEFFSYALTKTKSSPSECYMIGDSWEDDILGANRHGLNAIHLLEQFSNEQTITELDSPNSAKIYQCKNIISALDFVSLRFGKR